MAVRMEHIVVEQQHTGHFVDIGVAGEIAGGEHSWYTMDAKMRFAVETANANSLDWAFPVVHLDNSYHLRTQWEDGDPLEPNRNDTLEGTWCDQMVQQSRINKEDKIICILDSVDLSITRYK